MDRQWSECLGTLNTRWGRVESRKEAGVHESHDTSTAGTALK